ncbi:MAG: ABC transporter ATP-binding protein [Bacteroidetes bacterium]|nr:ABC transporter ATP-binding protein [Bacteroidota bacterium]
MILVKDLRKKYKGAEEEALKGIDLVVRRGELFGLIGPNSAGKTTLISILCGLLKYDEGMVEIDGINMKFDYKKIKGKIGLIPQEIALHSSLTVKENLNYFGSLQGITGKDLENRVEDCLTILQLHQHSNKKISKCSGGIKRRTNLMAGLIHNPSIVFLDEPTLGVDVQSRNLIFEYLQDLNKLGVTIVYTTHYMREVESLCSRVAIIDDGHRIVEGTPKELIDANIGCFDLTQVFIKLTGKEIRD